MPRSKIREIKVPVPKEDPDVEIPFVLPKSLVERLLKVCEKQFLRVDDVLRISVEEKVSKLEGIYHKR